MKKAGLLILVLVLMGGGLAAAGLNVVDPESVGLSAERLKRIESHFQKYVDDGKLAGVTTVIARRGQLAQAMTYGFADLESRQPLTPESIFRIYSMTKPVVGVGMMILFEEGKFQLTDPVSKFIPEFKGLKVDAIPDDGELILEEANREMTIRQLMTHTSGLTYGAFSKSDVDTLYREAEVLSPDATLKDMIRKLSQIPLRQQPGTQFHYSVSVDVQGYLIEVLSGQPLDVFMRERIFEPLGMVDTGFYVSAEKRPRLTTVYAPPREGEDGIRVVDHPSKSRFTSPPTFLSGGGGLVSTAADYLRFCQMLLNEGELDGVRVLGPRTVRFMSRNHVPPSILAQRADGGAGFGLNFAVILDPALEGSPGSEGEYYWGGLASTLFWIDPKEDLVAILMTQFIPSQSYPLRQELRALVYQAIIE